MSAVEIQAGRQVSRQMAKQTDRQSVVGIGLTWGSNCIWETRESTQGKIKSGTRIMARLHSNMNTTRELYNTFPLKAVVVNVTHNTKDTDSVSDHFRSCMVKKKDSKINRMKVISQQNVQKTGWDCSAGQKYTKTPRHLSNITCSLEDLHYTHIRYLWEREERLNEQAMHKLKAENKALKDEGWSNGTTRWH